MLRNWLILVSDKHLAEPIKEGSSYKVVESLKDVRVSLLSGEFSGVIVLSILESDTKSFAGFISGLKNHPELKKVQVILSNNLDSLFSADDKVGLRLFNMQQIGKLIDIDLGSEENQEKEEYLNDIQTQSIEVSQEEFNSRDKLEYLKHVCAKVIANMLIKGEIEGDKGHLMEVLCQRVRETDYE